MVVLRVLGPLAAEVGGRAVDLGGPRQRAVLALLLTARGATLSTDRMLEELWRGAPPPRARVSLQAYVSHLRRVLEPGRSRRAPASLLVSSPPGYALRVGAESVDAWRFEQALGGVRGRVDDDPRAARAELVSALGLWRGDAYAEFAGEPWAVTEAARLAGLRRAAREWHTAATLRLGLSTEAAAAAEALTGEEPLREEGWRLLALALWAEGRQADALGALRRARRHLAEELGLDPGPELAGLEDAILNQRWGELRRWAPGHGPVPATSVSSALPVAAPAAPLFVGRAAEVAALERAAEEAGAGAVRIVLVSGEAGVGKSSLLARCTERLAAGGWLIATGRCPETEGAPPAWAWEEIASVLAGHTPPGPWADDLAPLLESGPGAVARRAGDRFRLHRAFCGWLAATAARQPLAVVLDDLHRADRETLALLGTLADDLPDGRLLLVAAYRPGEGDGDLAAVQARLARRAPLRLPLGGLPSADAVRLVQALAPVDDETAAALAERTDGNPFYLQETARMLTGGPGEDRGSATVAADALSGVPEGIREVLRQRFARLSPDAVTVLRLAAVAGRETDVEVLAGAAAAGAGEDEGTVLDALDAGIAAGLLTEPGPGRVRFAHALVRDTLYADLSGVRRARMHTALAHVLRELRPDDVSAIALHYLQGPSSATAALAVDYAVRAAHLAGRRYAHDTAAGLLEQAAGCLEDHPAAFADGQDVPAKLVDVLGQLLRARLRGGSIAAARDVRARAMDVAEQHGRDDLLVQALTSWTEPTAWEVRDYAGEDTRVVAALRRLLARDGLDAATRCRLLDALAGALGTGAGSADDARAAAGEAVDLARGVGDPELLAQALSGLSRVMDWEFAPAPRAAVAAELARLAVDHDMPAYVWVAEYLAAGNAAMRGDIAALRRHVARGRELAEVHRLGDAAAVGLVQQAMLCMAEGRVEEAERGYAEAVARMRANGSLHADGFGVVALFAVRWLQGRTAEALPMMEAAAQHRYAPLSGDSLALALLAAGRPEEARAARAHRPPVRRDFFFSLFMSARALAVVALGEYDEAEQVMAELLPLRDVVAGAASTTLAMGPVAQRLGELAAFLGRPEEAAGHFAHAAEIARRWQAPHWEAEAKAALEGMR